MNVLDGQAGLLSARASGTRIIRLGQGLFAIASAGLALWSLTYGQLAWRSLPAWVPWREAWVYASASVVLIASGGLCFSRTALPSALTIGGYQAVSAAIFASRVIAKPLSIGAWYPVCEALTMLVGAWVLYALLQRRSRGGWTLIAGDGAVRAAQVLFGLTCIFYGWSHFVYVHYTASMVPAWLPSPLVVAYLTGLGHIVAGLAIAIGVLPRLAATLEASMMSSFGLLVWVPSYFAQPRPAWAGSPANQWSELIVTAVVAASAWVVAISLANRSWTFLLRLRA